MEFSRISVFSCCALLLCTTLVYGQATSPPAPVALSPTPTPAPAYVNLTELLSVAGPFHTFLGYLESTKVIDTFQNQANNTEQGITIFVPKDNAFKGLRKPSLSNLSDDQLKSLILFHALPKFYSLSDFSELSTKGTISTLAGGQYALNFIDDSGTVHLDSGWSKTKVTSAVHSTDPVAIYQVDKVLLPEAIFGTNIPPTPAPAPAPAPDTDISPAVAADSPSAESKESSSSPEPSPSTSSSHRILNLGIWRQVVLAILAGGVGLFC
ncbi:Fasciclin-like arabinogalactan protein 7 [Hibiscus syriacus]|uniref:Fasciclin-like arabinogalactan protein 7 n=1 Tax=Hibiscus syriacus TaxID=106335 RepID=A0A6A3BWK0_HIBSY|nr:fasciclin-like arabinogalactan protein 7 [Hibiscus syriacus]KAE8720281.1 Fasciclin-like arabinogalactan protein 7 [Hibiscus syriacus]